VIKYSFKNGLLFLVIQVVPRASRSEVVGEHNGLLRIRVAAPPVDGAANDELIRMLAKQFEVPRSAVSIIGGHNNRLKQVRIKGVERNETVRKLLGHR
jgi:uncharacterized protein (TIGR00251 family)